jgi:folylpolyglutamate synthase/dihydropteroate synthase
MRKAHSLALFRMRISRHDSAVEASSLKIVTEDVVGEFNVKVYPDMLYQRRNASLPIRLAEAALKQLDPQFGMTSDLTRSIGETILSGRNEIISRKNIWLHSVAHNMIGIQEATEWS